MKYFYLIFLTCTVSCKEEVEPVREPVPRSQDEIFADRMNIVSLYMTSFGEQRKRPGGHGYFAEGGKVFWPAMECANPKCPGRGDDGAPHIFVIPDPGVVVRGSNQLSYDVGKAKVGLGDSKYYGCQKCFPLRTAEVAKGGLGEETTEQKELYESFVVPHLLPESRKQLELLKAEMHERVQWEKRQKAKKVPQAKNEDE